MISCVQEGASESVSNNVYSAVLTFASVLGNVNLTQSELLRDVRAYIKKSAIKKHKERDPLLYEDLKKIVKNTDWSNLVNARDTVLFVVAWHSFLRYSDIRVIKVSDISVERDHFTLFISKSKTDPSGEGQTVVVARNQSELDPWSLVRWYMEKMEFSSLSANEKQSTFLFPHIEEVGGNVVSYDNTPIKYQTVQASIKSVAKELGLDLAKAGSHCLRIGGATSYTQRGVSSEVVMAKGRWRCESTRLKYARVTARNIIETSQIF